MCLPILTGPDHFSNVSVNEYSLSKDVWAARQTFLSSLSSVELFATWTKLCVLNNLHLSNTPVFGSNKSYFSALFCWLAGRVVCWPVSTFETE